MFPFLKCIKWLVRCAFFGWVRNILRRKKLVKDGRWNEILNDMNDISDWFCLSLSSLMVHKPISLWFVWGLQSSLVFLKTFFWCTIISWLELSLWVFKSKWHIFRSSACAATNVFVKIVKKVRPKDKRGGWSQPRPKIQTCSHKGKEVA